MNAKLGITAPTGRNKPAQGKERSDAALGHKSQNTPSPEGAKESDVLPSGWEWKSVGEMVDEMQYGTSAKTSEDATGVPVLRMGNIKDGSLVLDTLKYLPAEHGEFPALLLHDGDLLFNRTNSAELVGKSAIYRGNPSPCSCASYLIRARLRHSYVPEFLAYYINSTFGRAWVNSVVSQQVGQANVNGTKLKALSVPVPPLPEQRRIVAEIEKQFTRLEAGVAALRRVQANLKRYRAAVLKAACEGRLVPTGAEWPQKEIAAAIQTMDQGWSPKCESAPSNSNATWAVIKTTAIQNLRFLEDENKTLPAPLKPRAHLELMPGDLLVTRAGPHSRVGVACLVKSTRPRLMLCDKAYRLRCKPDVVYPAFLELVLNAPHILDEVNKLKTGISDSGVNLTQKRFGELLIPLPPLGEQPRIVAEVERRLSVVEELEAVVSANLQRATRLRQSILQKAFTGRL